MLYEVEPFLR